MAEALSSFDLLLTCSICFKEFEDDGALVPRILPCSHSLCDTCIGQLIQGNQIECPKCKSRHEIRKEGKTFPQNRYIMAHIKRKNTEQQTPSEFEKCEEHGKELNLFCLNSECYKAVCRTCLRKKHKKHDITDIEEHEKETLVRDTLQTELNLKAKSEIISEARNSIGHRTVSVIEMIKKKKEETLNFFDKMIKETEGQID